MTLLWGYKDLLSLLVEVAGDVELAATRISEGEFQPFASFQLVIDVLCHPFQSRKVTPSSGAPLLAKRKRRFRYLANPKMPGSPRLEEAEAVVVEEEAVFQAEAARRQGDVVDLPVVLPTAMLDAPALQESALRPLINPPPHQHQRRSRTATRRTKAPSMGKSLSLQMAGPLELKPPA